MSAWDDSEERRARHLRLLSDALDSPVEPMTRQLTRGYVRDRLVDAAAGALGGILIGVGLALGCIWAILTM
jgi:hypothetical protein